MELLGPCWKKMSSENLSLNDSNTSQQTFMMGQVAVYYSIPCMHILILHGCEVIWGSLPSMDWRCVFKNLIRLFWKITLIKRFFFFFFFSKPAVGPVCGTTLPALCSIHGVKVIMDSGKYLTLYIFRKEQESAIAG